MNKSFYDQDATTWGPKGKLFQVDYAMEAVNQGTCLVGLRSDTHVVLVGLRTQVHPLAYYRSKLYQVDSHLAIGISGLTPDGVLLHKFMKNQALNHNYVYGNKVPVEDLVVKIANSRFLTRVSSIHATRTKEETLWRGTSCSRLRCSNLSRKAGLAFSELVRQATTTNTLYNPNKCYAIGDRSQTANTYLENNMHLFGKCSVDELISHGIEAMKVSQDVA